MLKVIDVGWTVIFGGNDVASKSRRVDAHDPCMISDAYGSYPVDRSAKAPQPVKAKGRNHERR